MELVRVELLKHIEGYSKKRVETMKMKIVQENLWVKPICIEKNHYLVLDGQHRLEAAKELGLTHIPCELFDYKDVEVWSLRPNHQVNPALVIEKTLRGDIYPYKTAKHRFPMEIKECNLPLDCLK